MTIPSVEMVETIEASQTPTIATGLGVVTGKNLIRIVRGFTQVFLATTIATSTRTLSIPLGSRVGTSVRLVMSRYPLGTMT